MSAGHQSQYSNVPQSVLPSFSVFKSNVPTCDGSQAVGATPARLQQEQSAYGQAMTTVMETPPSHHQATMTMIESPPITPERKEAKLESALNVLRSFPSSFDLFVPPGMSYEKLDTFLIMYKTHCHRLIDAVICSDFEDVQVYIGHFWSEIPDHLRELLSTDFLSRVIETCDQLFYEALEIVLLPANYEDITDHVTTTLETVLEGLPVWVSLAMRTLPKSVADGKVRVMEEFLKMIRRQLSLIPLLKSCHIILSQPALVRKMTADLKKLDFSGMREDINLLSIEGEAMNEIKSLLALFLTAKGEEESSGISINTLAFHVKDSMSRVVRNSSSAASSTTTSVSVSPVQVYDRKIPQ